MTEVKKVHIGVLPPPLGGISVYLYRLKKKYEKDIFIDERTISLLKLLMLILKLRKNIIVYHMPSRNRRLLIGVFCILIQAKYKFVLHGHGLEKAYQTSNLLIKLLIKFIAINCFEFQLVGRHLKIFLERLGVKSSKIIIKDAFIEPPIEDEEEITRSYSPELKSFIDKHHKLILANAAFIAFDSGVDLYGIDMCVDLIEKISQEDSDCGMIIAIADINNAKYLENLISNMNYRQNLFILTGQNEIWPLFKHCNLMVRPTSIDGYGVSIAEAIHFDCPALASDVCERHHKAKLFKSRDNLDFYNKASSILFNKS